MPQAALSLNVDLAPTTRLPALPGTREQRISAAELLVLALAGVTAACAASFLTLGIRVPGHAILYATFPMALGYAVSPRRGSGTLMAVWAGVIGLLLVLADLGRRPLAAFVAVVALGPMLDLAAHRGRSGWRWYVAFATCAIVANWLAFLTRAASAQFGLDLAGSREFLGFWPMAFASYTACGLAAGLMSAAAWFRASRPATSTRDNAKRSP